MSVRLNSIKRARVFLVDDHPLVREALRNIIQREPDLMVCGEAASQDEALAAMAASKPDVAIVDLKLKNSDGLDLIKIIRHRHPKTLVLVLSMHDELLNAERTIRAGACGYISKQEGSDKIVQALRKILDGETYCSEKVALHMASRIGRPSRDARKFLPDSLSEVELQVFELIGRGHSTRQIAELLYKAVSTIETYRTRIKTKLVLKDAHELRQEAIRWHITKAAG